MAAVSPEAKERQREANRQRMRRLRAEGKAGATVPFASLSEEQKAKRRETWKRSREKHREKRNEAAREYKDTHREQINERRRRRRAELKAANPEKLRELDRFNYAAGRRFAHGRDFFEMFNQMWSEQEGKCYLCREPLPPLPNTHVDHDHACCPKGRSCSFCRRGLACDRCNKLVGQAGDSPELLRRVADNFEPVLLSTKARLGERSVQGTLWGDAA